MTKNTKAVVLGDQDCDTIIDSINEINIARMDASVLHSSIVDLLESFEYRDRDKEAIDSLYTFTRFLGECLATVKSANDQMLAVQFSKAGAA
jgi:hypothetical protein